MTTVNHTKEYNEQFPGLEETPLVQPNVTHGKKKQRSQRQTLIPLSDCGFTSHIDHLKNTRRKPSYINRSNDRADAYEKLQDKKGMAEKLVKSKMCWSVKQGVPCPHGEDKCNFAHTVVELRAVKCLFGRNCRFVHWDNEQKAYTNATMMYGYHCCYYTHPMPNSDQIEDRKTWLARIDVAFPAKVKTKTGSVLDLVPSQVTNAWKKVAPGAGAKEAASVNLPPCDEVSLLEPEPARYSVPKELAVETLKSAMEEGQTVIILELT